MGRRVEYYGTTRGLEHGPAQLGSRQRFIIQFQATFLGAHRLYTFRSQSSALCLHQGLILEELLCFGIGNLSVVFDAPELDISVSPLTPGSFSESLYLSAGLEHYTISTSVDRLDLRFPLPGPRYYLKS